MHLFMSIISHATLMLIYSLQSSDITTVMKNKSEVTYIFASAYSVSERSLFSLFDEDGWLFNS